MNRSRLHWALIAGTAAAVGVGAALSMRALTELVDATLPDARGIASFNRPGTITLLSTNGKVIQKLGPATREKVKPGAMPPTVAEAFIAAEDRRFYQHDGVDGWGIARAIVTNVRQGAVREGASTITQQLARTVFLSQDRTITRKLKEAALAMKLERQLSKQQILEQYLNYVYLGSGAYGVADAAWIYFSKTPEQLTVPEAAMIAGLPPAPSIYSPLVNPDLAKEQRSIVLDRMAQSGFISASEAERGRNSPLGLKPATPKYFNSSAPYFTTWIAQELPKFLTPEQLEVGGVKVRTSLNLDWQKKAQQVIRANAPFDTEGAMVSIDPGNGLVRVMVGGKDFSKSQFNRTILALRSPGSTFKLFPYAAAIDRGMKPETKVFDAKRCWNGYCPKNFGNKYYGNISLADALKNSLNTVAVQLQDIVGFDAVIEVANNFNIGTDRPLGKYYPMAIGAYEQTILDMTAAYAGMANRGVFFSPSPFEEIRGPKNELLWSRRLSDNRGKRAIDSDVADTMNWMLQRVVTGGTGIAAKLDDRQVAGKTGTSENTRDLWFIGSIPQLTTGVWFGYDDDRATKSTSGEAAWAWKQFMLQIKDEIPVRNFPDKPKLKRKVRLAVDPKTIAKPPKTKPEQEKGNGSGEPDGAQPTGQTDLPDLTPLAPPPRQIPYLWRDSSPGRSVDRQGRRWTRD
ncbi:penicillin-binding-like protein 1A (PBP1A)(transpeptidase) [Synechococcus sp. RS9907]|uniref:transglycosylase domain-containing protein n=1 Tax=Synechococcus sp. RS9907 TaxID=221350 RepID=UPI00165E8CDA|nr:PBP1A family penicillin-binding protein [Synechococcus sp. RS9907]QNI81648.1 penicillin-binding-like protein 1A (PBP1A)(transpeptidase) [Synechococcus sp. RS9907]